MKARPAAKVQPRNGVAGDGFADRMRDLQEDRPALVSLGDVVDQVVARFDVDRECAIEQVCEAILASQATPVYYVDLKHRRQSARDRAVAISNFRVNGWFETASGVSYASVIRIPRQAAERLFAARPGERKSGAGPMGHLRGRPTNAKEAKDLLRLVSGLKQAGVQLGRKNPWAKKAAEQLGCSKKTVERWLELAEALVTPAETKLAAWTRRGQKRSD